LLSYWALAFHNRSKQANKVFEKLKNLSGDIFAKPPSVDCLQLLQLPYITTSDHIKLLATVFLYLTRPAMLYLVTFWHTPFGLPKLQSLAKICPFNVVVNTILKYLNIIICSVALKTVILTSTFEALVNKIGPNLLLISF
jgi:hypothetical protein